MVSIRSGVIDGLLPGSALVWWVRLVEPRHGGLSANCGRSPLIAPAAVCRAMPHPPGDQAGDMSAVETGVDVHDHHVRGAAIEHSQERRHPLEMGPVADARRHGDHRAVDQSADHAGQRPFHPRHDHQGIGILQMRKLVQEPVQAGDADVGDQRDLAVPGLGGDPRLLGHRQVAGPGRHDHDPAELRPGVAGPTDPERPAQGVVLALGEDRDRDAPPPEDRRA